MYHQEKDFDDWWENNIYRYNNISKEEFRRFPVHNGFIIGIGISLHVNPKSIDIGDIIIYRDDELPIQIGHRVIDKWKINDTYYFKVMGDNSWYFETIPEKKYHGKWFPVFPEFFVRDGCMGKA